MTATTDDRFANSACLRARGTAQEGKVAFAELFFDLVFVLTIIQLSHSLAAHYSLLGLVEAAMLTMAIWWVWIDTTWVTNWLDPDKAPVRLLLFVLMFLGLMLSIAIPTAFGAGGLLFALVFVTMQVGRAAFTAYVMRREWPQNSLNFTRITIWAVFSGVFWLAGAFVEGEARLGLWLVALAIEYASPALGFVVPGLGRSTVGDWQVSGEHMAERCALFVIICLGETILVTGRTVAGMELLDGFTILLLAVAFLSTATMWWIYFRFGHGEAAHLIEHSATPGRIARMAFTYAHIPIVAGIILSAVAEEFALAHPHGAVDFKTASAIIGGPVVFLAGNIWFKAAIRGRSPLSHIAGIAALLALSVAVPLVEPYQLFMAAAAVLFGVALWEFLSLKSTRADHVATV
ncbi:MULTISPECIES: low temperature requirement protein A [unclassified Shinella]|uniref:low temperature requirement protein A n=1 Tax=unclassified Shinella TaxID=2643062 RepID=UPI00234ED253|nr:MULTISPECIES: low temperature requirement protein A [unclassified Shinella]MCO5149769.1 low temperature requirement protein A [Shinella sp.]MDC7262323.1 low temperature requirement protein A [Shinella sp. HY16]MDC7269218.1 low temperature requirement protein A [Shinella sp. YZ44]